MTEPTLAEAVDCMLEGTAATKPCKNHAFIMEDGTVGLVEDLKEHGDKGYTCAEGAAIYGAILRGYTQDYTDKLLITLKDAFDNSYGLTHVEINDESTYDDPRDEVIAMAKDLL